MDLQSLKCKNRRLPLTGFCLRIRPDDLDLRVAAIRALRKAIDNSDGFRERTLFPEQGVQEQSAFKVLRFYPIGLAQPFF